MNLTLTETLLYLFIIVVVFRFLYWKNRHVDRPLWDFGSYNPVILSIVAAGVTMLVVNVLVQPISFEDPQRQLVHAEKRDLPRLTVAAYVDLLEEQPLDTRYHYGLLKGYLAMHNNPETAEEAAAALDDLEEGYLDMTLSSDPAAQDAGHFGLGMLQFGRLNANRSYYQLLQVHNDTLANVNLLKALVSYHVVGPQKAVEYLRKEISVGGNLEEAYSWLGRIYEEQGRTRNLVELVKEAPSEAYFPIQTVRYAHYISNDFGAYFLSLFRYLWRKMDVVGLIGAFLIMLVWVLYLVKIDYYEKERWHHIVLTLLAGAVFALPTFLLTDVLRLSFGYDFTGDAVGDFIYTVVGIGMVEEGVKIIPFLFILLFTNLLDEPIDYIIYASLSALGFAFTENLLYLQEADLNVIHGRALLAVVSHMFDSSIVAYGLILARFRYHRHPLPYFLVAFLLASIAHGFYDYWLIQNFSSSYVVITIVFWTMSLFVFSSIINNALNNSPFYSKEVQIDTGRLMSYLFASLTGIFLFEYIVLSFIYGPSYGNQTLRESFLSGGFLLVFLSFNLSNIQIRRNRWLPIRFFTAHIPEPESLEGRHVRLWGLHEKSLLPNRADLHGVLVEQLEFGEDNRWHVLQLKEPLLIREKLEDKVLLRPIQADQHLTLEKPQKVFVLVPKEDAAIEQNEPLRSQFSFLEIGWVQ